MVRCSKYARVENKKLWGVYRRSCNSGTKGYSVATAVCYIFVKTEDKFIKPVKNKTQLICILLIHMSSHEISEV